MNEIGITAKLTTSVLILSLLLAVMTATKVLAMEHLPKLNSESKLAAYTSIALKSSNKLGWIPLGILTEQKATLEEGDLQMSELLTLNGLAWAASAVIGIRRSGSKKS